MIPGGGNPLGKENQWVYGAVLDQVRVPMPSETCSSRVP